MASSGNRTVRSPDRRRAAAARFFLALLAHAREKFLPFVLRVPSTHTGSLVQSRGTRYSDHEGIPLAPGTRESFTTHARVANIDEASQFACITRLKEPSEEVPPKELGCSDILVYARDSYGAIYATVLKDSEIA